MTKLFPLRYVIKTPTISLDITCEVPSEFMSDCNYIIFCYKCGLVWARIYARAPGEWISGQNRCPDCGGGHFINWYLDIHVILQFPIELLCYEVQIWQPPLKSSPQPTQQEMNLQL